MAATESMGKTLVADMAPATRLGTAYGDSISLQTYFYYRLHAYWAGYTKPFHPWKYACFQWLHRIGCGIAVSQI